MSSFQIDGQDPPAGAMPRQAGYVFHLPTPVSNDPMGRPVLNENDLPWVEIEYSRLNGAGWNWYCAFLESHKMYGELTSVRLLNPYEYTGDEPDWVTYSGDHIVLQQPTYSSIKFGNFFGVRIVIKGLE